MKRYARLLVVLTVVVSLLAVAGGCSKSSAPAPAAGQTGSGGGASKGKLSEVKIGVVAPLTGGGALYGQQMKNGAVLAVEEINKAGGILGAQIKLTVEDDKGSLAESGKATEKLVSQDKVNIWIGTLNSTNTIADLQLTNKANIPSIIPIAVADKITEGLGYKNVFRNSANNSMQVKALADYIVKSRKERNFAILAENTDYGRDLVKNFTEFLQTGGGKILTTEYYNVGDKDFYNQLTKIKGLKPEALLIAGLVAEGAQIARQQKELGLNVQLFSFGGFMGEQPIKLTGDAADGLIHTDYFSPVSGDPVIEKFLANYKAKYGTVPDTYYSAAMYDAIYLAKDAIERAKTLDPAAVNQALAETKDLPGVMGKTSFDAHGQANRPVWISQIKDGKQAVLYRPKQ